jgi:GT2 family glycosyltransferase
MNPPPRQPGVVVIGRNEGERLVRCLRSVSAPGRSVVYVDSGSTDGSVAAAGKLGASVVQLDMSRPFSASRGRNAGLGRLLEIDPGVEYVQFVDGDCEVAPEWLNAAVAALDAEPSTAAVCGRLRERHPERTIYNRLCDLEWDAPPGITRSCGGNAMYRVTPFRAVGGFNDDLVAGEEPELCYRLRQAGHSIRRLPDPMALHDADMHEFAQWWRRAARGGWAIAQGVAMHGRGPERLYVKRLASVLFWALALPAYLVAWAVVCTLLHWRLHPAPLWSYVILAGGLPALLYVVLAHRVRRALRARGVSPAVAEIAMSFTIIAKFAELTGIVRYWLRPRTRTPSAAPTFDKRPASA